MSDSMQPQQSLQDTRRDFLKYASVLTGLAVAGSSLTAGAAEMKSVDSPAALPDALHQMLVKASECLVKAEICSAHCLKLVAAGDTTISDCLTAVQATKAMCSALLTLASLEVRQLKAFVQVCVDVSKDCEKACRKHEHHHVQCKDCAEACAECIQACEAYLS
jgi:Cys-rich four helix bundle protein (predicted Tat secretion target)